MAPTGFLTASWRRFDRAFHYYAIDIADAFVTPEEVALTLGLEHVGPVGDLSATACSAWPGTPCRTGTSLRHASRR